MALARFTRPVDGTIPIPALLYDDETLLASQDGVGLYDGPNKSAAHQSGTLHVSSHRLFFIAGATSASPYEVPTPNAESGASVFLPLEIVSHTESYAGFFTSSSKVTLYLNEQNEQLVASQTSRMKSSELVQPSPLVEGHTSSQLLSGHSALLPAKPNRPDGTFDIWECEICGEKNAPGLSPAARNTCGLCGMPRAISTSVSNTPSTSTLAPQPIQHGQDPKTSAVNFKTSPGVAGVPIPHEKASASVSSSHLLSRSLPASSANTPAPLTDQDSAPGPSSPNPRKKRKPSAIACTVCTFLNHPYLRECEMCGTTLVRLDVDSVGESLLAASTSKSAPVSRPGSPAQSSLISSGGMLDPREAYIRLSFRKGGDKAFYAALKTALQQKAIETKENKLKADSQASSAAQQALMGIGGILDKIDLNNVRAELGMNDAFEDLQTLMSKAQAMVKLAKDLNDQLSAAQERQAAAAASGLPTDAELELLEPEEATFIRSSLGHLGLSMKNAAVTADMSGDERKYLEQLAVELSGILESGTDQRANVGENQNQSAVGIMRRRGIVGLDEVWGGWNRARGVSLISPEITLKVLSFLPRYTHPPIQTRVLSSGLRVIHTPAYSTREFSARLIGAILEEGPKASTGIAYTEKLPVGLVDDLVHEVEDRGDICRDDPMNDTNEAVIGVETMWWANAFVGYIWDGQGVSEGQHGL